MKRRVVPVDFSNSVQPGMKKGRSKQLDPEPQALSLLKKTTSTGALSKIAEFLFASGVRDIRNKLTSDTLDSFGLPKAVLFRETDRKLEFFDTAADLSKVKSSPPSLADPLTYYLGLTRETNGQIMATIISKNSIRGPFQVRSVIFDPVEPNKNGFENLRLSYFTGVSP